MEFGGEWYHSVPLFFRALQGNVTFTVSLPGKPERYTPRSGSEPQRLLIITEIHPTFGVELFGRGLVYCMVRTPHHTADPAPTVSQATQPQDFSVVDHVDPSFGSSHTLVCYFHYRKGYPFGKGCGSMSVTVRLKLRDGAAKTPSRCGYDAGICTSANDTGIFWSGTLPAGVYLIEEVEAPAGYNKMSCLIKMIVDGDEVTLSYVGTTGSSDSLYNTPEKSGDVWTITLINIAGVSLPNTGGPGTGLFTILGGILVMFAGLMLWRRRRHFVDMQRLRSGTLITPEGYR